MSEGGNPLNNPCPFCLKRNCCYVMTNSDMKEKEISSLRSEVEGLKRTVGNLESNIKALCIDQQNQIDWRDSTLQMEREKVQKLAEALESAQCWYCKNGEHENCGDDPMVCDCLDIDNALAGLKQADREKEGA